MKKLYLFAALAAMLAACSENDLTKETAVQQNAEEGAVTFDAYTQRATTRAGSVEIMKDPTLKKCGFGVFGFYTNNSDYDPQSIPNFFYNQKVEFNGELWTYEPVKYWPNEYGEDATSDDNDRVSYFAYAPYVEVVPSTGKLVKSENLSDEDKWGITGMTRNSAAGDPIIKYIASFDQNKAVDLIWGVCDNPAWSIIQGGTKQYINDNVLGLPWLNVLRPQEVVNQRLKFTFKHALSQLSVNVDAFVDGYNADKSLNSDQTRIFIRSISFLGFAMKGSLNLNNSEAGPQKAYWLDYNGTADLETGEWVTIYDGRKDGKEGATGSVATNEKLLGLNPQFVQDVEWNKNGAVNPEMTAGVTNIAATLFRSYDKATDKYVAATEPALVIPTGEPMEVEIVYDIETVDKKLSTYVSDGTTQGSSIENRIRKSINFGKDGLENGKHYTLNLHLGLNSVKFDAEVSDWVEAPVSPEADLPSNMPSYKASTETTTPSKIEVDWDYATTSATTKEYLYAVTGFNGGEAVATAETPTGCSVTINSKADFSGNDGFANASGVAYVKLTITAANDKVTNNGTDIVSKVKGGVSQKTHELRITQLARPLGLKVKSITSGTIVLTKTAEGDTHWQQDGTGTPFVSAYVKVLKNGEEMKKADGAGNFTFADGTITLGTALVPGDIYTITVKTGDAAEETVVANIGGIKFSADSRTLTYRSKKYDAYLPTLYGPSTTYTWTSSKKAVATVSDGEITTVKSGDTDITAKLKSSYISEAKKANWFFIVTQAEYTLTVERQAVVGAATDKTITDKPSSQYGFSTNIVEDVRTLFTFKGKDEPEATLDGVITYTITETKRDDVDATGDIIKEASGNKLYVNKSPGLTPGTYKVTVEATIPQTDKFEAATASSIITFKVTD